MLRWITFLALALVGFAAPSWGQLHDWRLGGVPKPWQLQLSCGQEGSVCCEPYQGSSGVIGPEHCDIGLGCNVATNTCERPCGGAGQVCCDGPETWAAQGGPVFVERSGNIVPRKNMCEQSSCDRATRRCVASCGMNEGEPCCGPQPDLGVASCVNPALACRFAGDTTQSGTCEACGGEGQIACVRGRQCADGLEEDGNGRCRVAWVGPIVSPTFPGKCVEAYNQGQTLTRGASLRLAACNGSAQQAFRYNFHNGTVSMPRLTPELCMDLAGPHRNDQGAMVNLCNGSTNQQWSFPWNGRLRPIGADVNKCLTHTTREGKPATGWTIDILFDPGCDMAPEGGAGGCSPAVEVYYEMAIRDCDDRGEQDWRMLKN